MVSRQYSSSESPRRRVEKLVLSIIEKYSSSRLSVWRQKCSNNKEITESKRINEVEPICKLNKN